MSIPHVTRVLLVSTVALLASTFALPSSARAEEPPAPDEVVVPVGYGAPPPLSSEQRLSIEHGAADLGGATEQSLLAASLYIASVATLLGGIAISAVYLAVLAPSHLLAGGTGDPAQVAAIGSALACFVAHAITTPLAVDVDLGARRRHRRAREELLLVVSPLGVSASGRF